MHRLVARRWMLLVAVLVVAVAGFCVSRLRGIFGSNHMPSWNAWLRSDSQSITAAAIGSTYAPDVHRTDGEGVRVNREALEAMDRGRRSGSHSSALRSQPPRSAAAS
jgi:hypothetical protein